jgi:AcrR family transcriptional regulator
MKAAGRPVTERKERKRAEREARILAAAEELIVAQGYAATTIDGIAAKADVSKGAVYLHYHTKEDIFFSITRQGLELLLGMFKEAASEEKEGLEKFRAVGHAFYEFNVLYPGYARILFDENMTNPSQDLESVQACRALNEQIGGLMVYTIELGKQDGSVRPDADPVAAALIISASLQGLVRSMSGQKRLMKERNIEEKQMVDYAIDLYGRSLENLE